MTVAPENLHHEIKISAEPILLTHAGFLHRRMWDEQFELLAELFKLITFGVRGFGKPSRPSHKYSHIKDPHTLLTTLKVDKSTVVGVTYWVVRE